MRMRIPSYTIDLVEREYWLGQTTRYIRYITPLHAADNTPPIVCSMDSKLRFCGFAWCNSNIASQHKMW